VFSSGLVKLVSGDATWRELTALTFHYQTQPLPAWTSWYAHQLPEWLQVFSVAVMFFVELVVPFCVFAPRRVRIGGGIALVGLQGLIGLTGNYGFFNLLSVVLCLPLLDDRVLARLPRFGLLPMATARAWPRGLVGPLAVLLAVLGAFQLSRTARLDLPWPDAVGAVYGWCRPFYLVNFYGLFAVMTTERSEIEVEGSMDGQTWRVYAFGWKPGALDEAPSFTQPHMPRLDWQMWFAALRTYRDYPWFTRFMVSLLQGKSEVLALLEHNPFPERPPRYVRARLYDYRFTGWEDKRAGRWWQRREKGLYCPVLELKTE
jgi:hypothetical protein